MNVEFDPDDLLAKLDSLSDSPYSALMYILNTVAIFNQDKMDKCAQLACKFAANKK